jgi:glyoxylase-like metal-dependent hydrolase (beta-lactamase superfamily II)
MLMAYLPNEKLLFVSDLFTPGAVVDAANKNGIDNATALYAGITNNKLAVDRIVGGHGEVTAPLADLAKIAAMKSGS